MGRGTCPALNLRQAPRADYFWDQGENMHILFLFIAGILTLNIEHIYVYHLCYDFVSKGLKVC